MWIVDVVFVKIWDGGGGIYLVGVWIVDVIDIVDGDVDLVIGV